MPLVPRGKASFEVISHQKMLTDPEKLALVNPNAKHPFDPLEWQEKWLNDPVDASIYFFDGGAPVDFFTLRIEIRPHRRSA